MASAAIEKKMDMSLDEIIKLNKARATSSSSKGAAPKLAGQTGSKAAPKLLSKVSKPGVAGKRQAIQQKRSAPVTLADAPRSKTQAGGVRVGQRTAPVTLTKSVAKGGVAKPGAASGKRLKQTMAQKILTRARNAKQQSAPRGQGAAALAKRRGAATQAPKQLVASKPTKQPVQFSLPGGRRPPQGSPAKSLAQQMKRPRGGRPVQAPKQLAGGAATRQGQGSNGRAPLAQPQRGGRGPAAPQQQLNRVARGAVHKPRGQHQQQQRAPVFMGNARLQALPAPVQRQQQQQFSRGGGGQGAGRRQAVQQQQQQRQQGRGGRPQQHQHQQHAAYNAPITLPQQPQQHAYPQHRGNGNQSLLAAQQQQVALAALRMQQLEEARQRAERAAFIHASMQVLTPHLGRRG